jgi:hypothetical protein
MRLTVDKLVSALEDARPFIENQNIVDETIASVTGLKDEGLSSDDRAAKAITSLTKIVRVLGQLMVREAAQEVVHRIVEFVSQLFP